MPLGKPTGRVKWSQAARPILAEQRGHTWGVWFGRGPSHIIRATAFWAFSNLRRHQVMIIVFHIIVMCSCRNLGLLLIWLVARYSCMCNFGVEQHVVFLCIFRCTQFSASNTVMVPCLLSLSLVHNIGLVNVQVVHFYVQIIMAQGSVTWFPLSTKGLALSWEFVAFLIY